MRFQLIPILLATFLSALPSTMYSNSTEIPKNEDSKALLKYYQTLLENSDPSTVGDLKAKLAVAYYKDQEQEKAFQIYLEALEDAQINHQSAISNDEKLIYDEALAIYLDNNGTTPLEIAQKILENYSLVLKEHSNYHLVGFIVALANANIGNYDQFFDLFFRSYKHFPEHYLAYKTKAILYLKLFERSRTQEIRDTHRRKLIENFQKAIDLYPQDASLYRLSILFAPQDRKEKLIIAYLNKIVDNNIIIPRGDIAFYVKEAAENRQYELAQRFLDKTHEWYQFSRIINSSQQFLDQQRYQKN